MIKSKRLEEDSFSKKNNCRKEDRRKFTGSKIERVSEEDLNYFAFRLNAVGLQKKSNEEQQLIFKKFKIGFDLDNKILCTLLHIGLPEDNPPSILH